MSKYGLEELIKDAVKSFNDSSSEMDKLFEPGTELEILSDEGYSHVKDSIVSTIKSALDKAKINSRKLLTEKSIVSSLEKAGGFNEQTKKHLSERAHNLQLKYQESYKEVVNLESLLSRYQK